MRQYWGVALHSDWQPGSPIGWRDGPDPDDTVVLEADRPRRLSYTWHNYQPEHAARFGWDDARLAELRQEPLTKVTFDIEPYGSTVKLTVTHQAFIAGSEMLRAVSGRDRRRPAGRSCSRTSRRCSRPVERCHCRSSASGLRGTVAAYRR